MKMCAKILFGLVVVGAMSAITYAVASRNSRKYDYDDIDDFDDFLDDCNNSEDDLNNNSMDDSNNLDS